MFEGIFSSFPLIIETWKYVEYFPHKNNKNKNDNEPHLTIK